MQLSRLSQICRGASLACLREPIIPVSLQSFPAWGNSVQQQGRNYSVPQWQSVEVTADGEPNATIVKSHDKKTFTIRDRYHSSQEEERCATPVSHFLGAIVSGSQSALISSAKEMKLPVGHVKWYATGKYDIRGTRGEEDSVSQLKGISIVAELDSNATSQQLETLRQMVQRRSILANTISRVQGLDFVVEYKSAFNFQSSMGTHI